MKKLNLLHKDNFSYFQSSPNNAREQVVNTFNLLINRINELEEKLELINKPVTTTNEQPKSDAKKKCNNLSGLCTCDLGYPCK